MTPIIMALIFLGVCVYLGTGFYFMCLSAWALGMPDHMCREWHQKLKRNLLTLSMMFFWPGWMIYIVVN
ncbi:Hypothetical protein KNT65_gp093 [Escherichia phage EcS1]|uniref:Transmembrane protein n=1 Tax=Escherichia phage EcS1 TaxID=2083276 RepID=A0A2Z5ZCH5_9CAUD|nr:Hypothetical protein KNT65_gp093 [Escherichia phage EcS1]BBC78141.1 Hypothetical protein [Escherichia phage EcS1]